MKNDTYDVIVVGGGPAGATAAHDLVLQGHKVLLLDRQGRIKPNLTRLLLQSHNTMRIQVRLKAIDRVTLTVPFKNGAFRGAIGVANGQPHHETVQLAFRKWIGTFKFMRVLRGQHEKRRAQ